MNRKMNSNLSKKYNIKWILMITLWTFILSIIFSLFTESLIKNLNVLFSFITLIVIIIIGIIFDIIGIAVTRAEEKPFHSMASKKVDGAKIAIALVRNAGPVSNFCNDVVGDISGIISGGIGANLIYKIIFIYRFQNASLLSILITAFTASLTVGGKALGKSIGLIYYEKIIIKISKTINVIENLFGLSFFLDNKSKRINKR